MIKLIEKYICSKENIDPAILHELSNKGKSIHKRYISETRQLIMYYAINNRYTVEKAGIYFGLNHSTASYAKKVINNLYDTNIVFRRKIDRLDKKLLNLYKLSEDKQIILLTENRNEKINHLGGLLDYIEDEILLFEKLFEKIKHIAKELRNEINEL